MPARNSPGPFSPVVPEDVDPEPCQSRDGVGEVGVVDGDELGPVALPHDGLQQVEDLGLSGFVVYLVGGKDHRLRRPT